MDSIITSIRLLLDELEEKIQMISKDKQSSNAKNKNIDSDNQIEIKEYINDLIREIKYLKENKKNSERK